MTPDGSHEGGGQDAEHGGPWRCSKCGGEHPTLRELWDCAPVTDGQLAFDGAEEDSYPNGGE